MNTELLDACVGLHEYVETHYYVDHYAVEFHVQDGNEIELVGKGDTIEDALNELLLKLSVSKRGVLAAFRCDPDLTFPALAERLGKTVNWIHEVINN